MANREPLPAKNRDHDLLGKYEGFRECHVQSDWLLVYRVDEEEVYLFLSRTGTHSDLFYSDLKDDEESSKIKE